MLIPQVGPPVRARSQALGVRWLLAASEEASSGWLLGLHQLLQALQHRQTQGLEPGGRHSQADSPTLQGTGRGGEQSEGAADAWARRHRVPGRLISATACLLPRREEPGVHPGTTGCQRQAHRAAHTAKPHSYVLPFPCQRLSSMGRRVLEWTEHRARIRALGSSLGPEVTCAASFLALGLFPLCTLKRLTRWPHVLFRSQILQ